MGKHQQDGVERKRFVEAFWSGMTVDVNGKCKTLPRSKHLLFNLKNNALDDEDDALVQLPEKFIKLVDDVTPVRIAKEAVDAVIMTNFDEDLNALRENEVSDAKGKTKKTKKSSQADRRARKTSKEGRLGSDVQDAPVAGVTEMAKAVASSEGVKAE